MHNRVERVLIASAILVAAVYAIVSFWPDDSSRTVPPPTLRPVEALKEQPVDTSRESQKTQAGVILSLTKIASAELSFRTLRKRFGTIDELVHENLLTRAFSEGVIIGGYQYNLSANTEHFSAYADPVPGEGRHYFIDETLDIRHDENGRASSSSPYLEFSKNENTETGNRKQGTGKD